MQVQKDESRPDPEELLARIKRQEKRGSRGRLKIFFGMAAGVGKTYAMLNAARRLKDAGVDVVVGYVEPHGRSETEALLDGLETLPSRLIEYRGTTLREFDLDRALERAPAVILFDELAHTNVTGSRHAKRWQDVDEVLDAGIDVITTINIQHLESINDVVENITGIRQRETIPDHVVRAADQIQLVDMTAEALRRRMAHGNIYPPEKIDAALGRTSQEAELEHGVHDAIGHRRQQQDLDRVPRADSGLDPQKVARDIAHAQHLLRLCRTADHALGGSEDLG